MTADLSFPLVFFDGLGDWSLDVLFVAAAAGDLHTAGLERVLLLDPGKAAESARDVVGEDLVTGGVWLLAAAVCGAFGAAVLSARAATSAFLCAWAATLFALSSSFS